MMHAHIALNELDHAFVAGGLGVVNVPSAQAHHELARKRLHTHEPASSPALHSLRKTSCAVKPLPKAC